MKASARIQELYPRGLLKRKVSFTTHRGEQLVGIVIRVAGAPWDPLLGIQVHAHQGRTLCDYIRLGSEVKLLRE